MVVEVDVILEKLLCLYKVEKGDGSRTERELLVMNCMKHGYKLHGILGYLRDISTLQKGCNSINAFVLYLQLASEKEGS